MSGLLFAVAGAVLIALALKRGKSGTASQNGTASRTRTRCPTCGAKLPPGARECGWCGDCW